MADSQQPGPVFQPPRIETPRLVIRAITWDDLPDIWEYASDAEVARYTIFDRHTSEEQTREFVRQTLEKYGRGEPAALAIALRSEGRLVGACGFRNWDRAAARIEIGYAIQRRHWGKGIATEAVRAVLGFAFEQMGLNRVEAHCIVDHVASRRVLEKAGMRREGILRQHESFKGAFQDLALYSILRQEFLPTAGAGSVSG